MAVKTPILDRHLTAGTIARRPCGFGFEYIGFAPNGVELSMGIEDSRPAVGAKDRARIERYLTDYPEPSNW